MRDSLINTLGVPRSSVLVSDISDHMPILLTWKMGSKSKGMPYKFNRAWLGDKEYIHLIKELWQDEVDLDELSGWDHFH